MAESHPAPFEGMREFMERAVEQLTKNMASAAREYNIPATEPLALLRRVAAVEKRHELLALRTWALRHVLPIHDFIEITNYRELSDDEYAALRKRLWDAAGYVVLALVMTEEGAK